MGGGKSVTTGGDDAAAGDKPVNIVVWHGQNQTAEKVFNRLVTRFNAVLRGETRVAAGDEVTLRVDPTRLRAFDPATGESPAGAYTSSTSTPSAASA